MSIIKKLIVGPTTIVFALSMLVILFLASHATWSLFVLKETIYSTSDLIGLAAIAIFAVILFIGLRAFFKVVESVTSGEGKR